SLNPVNNYANGKVLIEEFIADLENTGFNVAVLRFSNVYGGLLDHYSSKNFIVSSTLTLLHKSRISMIAGLRDNQIIESVIFEGNCNKEIFTTYVETILTKELHPEQTVVKE
ncbi:MAG: hypothetical protein O7C56_07020, partial [Rickettsia endosymbiont of Ixodes persulcatus]|nr:hypothetical protein [Rickettsia endosymbiont of Ixodes persulcatus]